MDPKPFKYDIDQTVVNVFGVNGVVTDRINDGTINVYFVKIGEETKYYAEELLDSPFNPRKK